MEPEYIPPIEVVSPKQHWTLIAVLDEGIRANSCALALGQWDNKPVLAMRWNGTGGNPVGNPQSRGLPTWFVLPSDFNQQILANENLDPEMVALAQAVLSIKRPHRLEQNDRFLRHQQDYIDLLCIISEDGGQKQFDPNRSSLIGHRTFDVHRRLSEMSDLWRLIEKVGNAQSDTYRITNEGKTVLATFS